MTSVYFSKQDFTTDMRNPTSAARCHALCRRIVATASQSSHWYGAHYWAACALLRRKPKAEDTHWYRRCFAREVNRNGEDTLPRRYEALWRLAVRRVKKLRSQALKLETSVLW